MTEQALKAARKLKPKIESGDAPSQDEEVPEDNLHLERLMLRYRDLQRQIQAERASQGQIVQKLGGFDVQTLAELYGDAKISTYAQGRQSSVLRVELPLEKAILGEQERWKKISQGGSLEPTRLIKRFVYEMSEEDAKEYESLDAQNLEEKLARGERQLAKMDELLRFLRREVSVPRHLQENRHTVKIS